MDIEIVTEDIRNRKLGVHLSINGGLHRAIEDAGRLKINTVQIFLKNNNRWYGKGYDAESVNRFMFEKNRHGITDVFAHSGYLINMAGSDEIRNKSRLALIDETRRAAMLKIPFLVVHPGSHGDSTAENGIGRVIRTINELFYISDSTVNILLETTAGQGTSLGYRFEQIAEIIMSSSFPSRLGVCLDTCHVFAAGYNFLEAGGYNAMMNDFQSIIGIERLKLVHINDSKRECGSRVDRHEHLGKGMIGIKGLSHFLRDPNLFHIPFVMETPKLLSNTAKGDDPLKADRMNLKRLRRMIAGQ